MERMLVLSSVFGFIFANRDFILATNSTTPSGKPEMVISEETAKILFMMYFYFSK